MHEWIAGIGATVGLSLGLWAVGKWLPGILVTKVHQAFEAAKNSEWFRNPLRPKRTRWLLATAELLEDELPEAGQGKEFYRDLGVKVSAHLPPVLAGSPERWAAALEKAGDALDTELDQQIKEIAVNRSV